MSDSATPPAGSVEPGVAPLPRRPVGHRGRRPPTVLRERVKSLEEPSDGEAPEEVDFDQFEGEPVPEQQDREPQAKPPVGFRLPAGAVPLMGGGRGVPLLLRRPPAADSKKGTDSCDGVAAEASQEPSPKARMLKFGAGAPLVTDGQLRAQLLLKAGSGRGVGSGRAAGSDKNSSSEKSPTSDKDPRLPNSPDSDKGPSSPKSPDSDKGPSSPKSPESDQGTDFLKSSSSARAGSNCDDTPGDISDTHSGSSKDPSSASDADSPERSSPSNAKKQSEGGASSAVGNRQSEKGTEGTPVRTAGEKARPPRPPGLPLVTPELIKAQALRRAPAPPPKPPKPSGAKSCHSPSAAAAESKAKTDLVESGDE